LPECLQTNYFTGSPPTLEVFSPKHLPVDKHFERWMELFTIVDTLFHGPVADEAKLRAQNMS
jgi:hypothetical protein